MNLYQNPHRPDHAENNAAFLNLVKDFPDLNLFQPSSIKAPWHFQATIDRGGEVQVINFWPHTLKGQREGYKSVEGARALRGIIEQAIIDASDPPFDVIEAEE